MRNKHITLHLDNVFILLITLFLRMSASSLYSRTKNGPRKDTECIYLHISLRQIQTPTKTQPLRKDAFSELKTANIQWLKESVIVPVKNNLKTTTVVRSTHICYILWQLSGEQALIVTGKAFLIFSDITDWGVSVL
jgi:hypothetical protein